MKKKKLCKGKQAIIKRSKHRKGIGIQTSTRTSIERKDNNKVSHLYLSVKMYETYENSRFSHFIWIKFPCYFICNTLVLMLQFHSLVFLNVDFSFLGHCMRSVNRTQTNLFLFVCLDTQSHVKRAVINWI